MVGMAGQTRGSIAVVYTLLKEDSEDKVAFSGGSLGFCTHLQVSIFHTQMGQEL